MKSIVERRGSKVIPIKSTGHEKQRITVCLAVKADGWKKKPFQQFQWVVDAWKKINKESMKKSFETCEMATSNQDKVHCLGEGQPTEEAMVLLGKSNSSIEYVQWPTSDDNMQEETNIYNVQNVEDLTGKILEEGEVEIIMILGKKYAASFRGRLLFEECLYSRKYGILYAASVA